MALISITSVAIIWSCLAALLSRHIWHSLLISSPKYLVINAIVVIQMYLLWIVRIKRFSASKRYSLPRSYREKQVMFCAICSCKCMNVEWDTMTLTCGQGAKSEMVLLCGFFFKLNVFSCIFIDTFNKSCSLASFLIFFSFSSDKRCSYLTDYSR